MNDDQNMQMHLRARKLWEENGKPNGKSYWEQAEAELRAEDVAQQIADAYKERALSNEE